MDRAVTYLNNNRQHMKYDKALRRLADRHRNDRGPADSVIEDRSESQAPGGPDGAETILKLRAVVVDGDLDDYMNYYRQRFRAEHHLARYDDTIDRLKSRRMTEKPEITYLLKRCASAYPRT